MKWNFPWRKIVFSLVGVLVLYGSVGLLLRKTGFLHPYRGKYLLLGVSGKDGFSPVLVRDPVVTRPLYALECLILGDDFLHRDREICGELTSLEIDETFQRIFRQSVPRGLIIKSARFNDIQYRDIMKREIVAEIPESGASELVRFLEDFQALVARNDDFLLLSPSQGSPRKALLNPKDVLEVGAPIQFEVSAPDFGCESSTDVTISGDRRLLTVRWSISD